VKSLGDAAVTVLGNHDLHLLALANEEVRYGKRFATLEKILNAPDREELLDWLRHRPLAHYDKALRTLLVHAGTYPTWTIRKTMARAEEVESVLRSSNFAALLGKMYGNKPTLWSGKLRGYARLRFIINCLTRMRMLDAEMHLNLAYSGSPFRARKGLRPWYAFESAAREGNRIVFGHWSALSLILLPDLYALDTGCVWGRQLTAVRIDSPVPQVYQVPGQV
jgi:bis(5'-nucleosyl)-tetraphosphatase (symmetrical)